MARTKNAAAEKEGTARKRPRANAEAKADKEASAAAPAGKKKSSIAEKKPKVQNADKGAKLLHKKRRAAAAENEENVNENNGEVAQRKKPKFHAGTVAKRVATKLRKRLTCIPRSFVRARLLHSAMRGACKLDDVRISKDAVNVVLEAINAIAFQTYNRARHNAAEGRRTGEKGIAHAGPVTVFHIRCVTQQRDSR